MPKRYDNGVPSSNQAKINVAVRSRMLKESSKIKYLQCSLYEEIVKNSVAETLIQKFGEKIQIPYSFFPDEGMMKKMLKDD